MIEDITEFEKIYIYTYLNEIKEDIFKILKQYNIKYFCKDHFSRNIFFDENDSAILRIRYDSSHKYIVFEDMKENEIFSIHFNELKNDKLWIFGNYYYYIVNQILNLENLPIEVRKD